MAEQGDSFNLYPRQDQWTPGRVQDDNHAPGQWYSRQVREGRNLTEWIHLVRQGAHDERLCLLQVFSKCMDLSQVGTQEKRIIEVTDQVAELDTVPGSHRRTDKQILLAAIAVQQHMIGSECHCEECYSFPPAQILESRIQRWLDRQIEKSTLRRWSQWIWMIDR